VEFVPSFDSLWAFKVTVKPSMGFVPVFNSHGNDMPYKTTVAVLIFTLPLFQNDPRTSKAIATLSWLSTNCWLAL
jgi:hypothetical protein